MMRGKRRPSHFFANGGADALICRVHNGAVAATLANAGFTLRFTNADRTAFVFRDARDVAKGRELTMPSSIFAWP